MGCRQTGVVKRHKENCEDFEWAHSTKSTLPTSGIQRGTLLQEQHHDNRKCTQSESKCNPTHWTVSSSRCQDLIARPKKPRAQLLKVKQIIQPGKTIIRAESTLSEVGEEFLAGRRMVSSDGSWLDVAPFAVSPLLVEEDTFNFEKMVRDIEHVRGPKLLKKRGTTERTRRNGTDIIDII